MIEQKGSEKKIGIPENLQMCTDDELREFDAAISTLY
jgi:hypothetical protein